MSQTLPIDPMMGNPRPMGGSVPSTPGVFKLRSKDGQIVPIRASTPEEAFDILDELEASDSLPKSSANRFVHGVADSLNPVNLVKGAAGMIMHPMDNIIAPMVVNRVKADEADKMGRTSEAMGYRAGGILPLVGPAAVNIGEQAGSGDIAGATGSLTGALLIPKVYGNVSRAVKTAAPVVANATKAVSGPVKAVGSAIADTNLPETLAGTAGAVAGGVPGMAAAVTAVELMRTAPKLYRAFKGWLEKDRGISGAQAESVIQKLSPEELAQIAGPDMRVLSDSEATAYWDRMASKRRSMPQAPKLPSTSESTIRPIPPSKLPPELPPEPAPVKMRETAAQKMEAAKAKLKKPEAKSDVVEAKPAFESQQGAKGATKSRFRMDAERISSGMLAKGQTEASVRSLLKNSFKYSDEEIADILRAVSGKGKS